MRIEFTTPIDRVVQEEIKQSYTHFQILKFEDNGTKITALTDLGYVLIYDEDEYPDGGIFSLDRDVIIGIVKSKIESIYL